MKKRMIEYTAVYKKDDGWYVGWIEEVPSAFTQGKTLKEVKENLRDALQLVLEANRDFVNGEIKVGEKVIREPLLIPR